MKRNEILEKEVINLVDEGYFVYKKKLFKGNKKVPWEEKNEIPSEVLELLADYSSYEDLDVLKGKKRDVYQMALDLSKTDRPGGSFRFWYTKCYRDYSPVKSRDLFEEIRKEDSSFDFDDMRKVEKALQEISQMDCLPRFWRLCEMEKRTDLFDRPALISDGEPFEFPDIVYSLIKYFLFEPKKKYILTIMSEGDQGKSTFTNFLSKLFKNEYFSAEVKYINQFSTSFIASNRLTVFNDCTSEKIENMHILKQITGGDEVQIEAKGLQAISGKINTYLLFIGNEKLTYDITDPGTINRFVNIPWESNIKGKKDPKWVDYDWSDEEIYYVIEKARNAPSLDFDFLLKETIKTSILESFHFQEAIKLKLKEDDYMNYYRPEKYNLSPFKMKKFCELVKKYAGREYLEKRFQKYGY